jgi:hypothetical protein
MIACPGGAPQVRTEDFSRSRFADRDVAEYLGHADVTTVSRYAHVAATELHAAVQTLGDGVYAMREAQHAPDQASAQAA